MLRGSAPQPGRNPGFLHLLHWETANDIDWHIHELQQQRHFEGVLLFCLSENFWADIFLLQYNDFMHLSYHRLTKNSRLFFAGGRVYTVRLREVTMMNIFLSHLGGGDMLVQKNSEKLLSLNDMTETCGLCLTPAEARAMMGLSDPRPYAVPGGDACNHDRRKTICNLNLLLLLKT